MESKKLFKSDTSDLENREGSKNRQRQLQFSQNQESYQSYPSKIENSQISQPLIEGPQKPAYSLMKNPIIPTFWRYSMPILIVINIGIFIWSNSTVGAYVYLELNAFGFTTPQTEIKRFTLTSSVFDMWKAGVYPLSILIGVFSGVWPYTKLVLMMLCWCLPKKKLGYKSRERYLRVLDTMGKWSLLDGYVMVLMLVAFAFTVEEQVSNTIISGGLNVYVIPGFGLYSFMVGTIISLAITHTEIKYHRLSHEHLIKRDLSLVSKLQPEKKSRMIIGGGILTIALALLIVGCYVDAFTFRFRGAASWILGGPEHDSQNFSMITLAHEPTFGIYFLTILYFLFSLVVPIIFLLVLTALWFKSMSLNTQRKLFTFAEILNAWSTVDVFIVSIVVSLVEIRQFAMFIIGDDCNLINDWMQSLTKYDVIIFDEPRCFDAETTLLSGCGLLFGSAGMYFIMSTIMLRYIQGNLEAKIDKRQKNISELKKYDQSISEEETDVKKDNQIYKSEQLKI